MAFNQTQEQPSLEVCLNQCLTGMVWTFLRSSICLAVVLDLAPWLFTYDNIKQAPDYGPELCGRRFHETCSGLMTSLHLTPSIVCHPGMTKRAKGNCPDRGEDHDCFYARSGIDSGPSLKTIVTFSRI